MPSVTDARGGIPAAKLRAVAAAIRRYPWREDTAGVARVAIKAADAWDAAQRLAAGPQPARGASVAGWED